MGGRVRRARPAKAPFVEIGGELYLDLSFDLEPRGLDPRRAVARELGQGAAGIALLRRLTRREARMVRRLRFDCDLEAWARIVTQGGPRGGR